MSSRPRREFLQLGGGVISLLSGLDLLLPRFAREPGSRALGGGPGLRRQFDLDIGRTVVDLGDQRAAAVTINGTIPGPLLRFTEGETAVMRVTNRLAEDTSIHWHGIILPNAMDGVPGVTFDGIRPGETFEYEFPLHQTGTYWYHSHSGFQEQLGVYGPMVIDPAGSDPIVADREYVVLLSDWTFEDPHRVMGNLKKMGGYYNFQRRTATGFFGDVADRVQWGRMRMDPTDIADITGATYTYLMNGRPPAASWSGVFRPGERVRLRFINGSAATYFDVRIPGLPMTVVQADGQDVEPVTVDEFRIAIAETFDVIVQPPAEQAYAVFAETMDRSGFAAGSLVPRAGMVATMPAPRRRPIRTMSDMGMNMAGMAMPGMDMAGMDHAGHDMGGSGEVPHGPDRHGVGNAAVPEVTRRRLDDPGIGLEDAGHRVLVYSDLRSATPWHDTRPPGREIELHLTGNMERYMWSFDGQKFSQSPDPIPFVMGERLRVTLVNDTMMEHPIHMHGMWMLLETGNDAFDPRKHTVNVKPAERLSFLVTVDAPGRWALHCHILYHMEAGMFRIIEATGNAVSGS